MPPSDKNEELEDQTGVQDTAAELETTDEVAASQTAEDAETTSEKPSAEDDGPATMAEAIAAALDQSAEADNAVKSDEDEDAETASAEPDSKAEADDGATKAAGEKQPDEDGADDAELTDPTDEELGKFKPQVRRRVTQLLAQRNAARQAEAELTPDAGRYRSLRTYMETNDLADQEVADLFVAGADLKSGEPKRLQSFLDRVLPLVQQALMATGQMTPPELYEQVENGEMTEEAAREIARSRAETAAANQRSAKAERTATEQQATRDKATHSEAVLSAVDTWRAKTRAADPDFDAKQDVMTKYAQALVAQKGLPKTAEQAVEYTNEVYGQVNKLFEQTRPSRKATRPTPAPGTSSPRSSPQAEPGSLEDVIRNGLAMTG